MRKTVWIAGMLLALTGMIASVTPGAKAQGATGGSQNIGLVAMNAQNGSGEDGGATLSEVGGKLVVTLNLNNGTDTPQPAHIHRGTCANLDPAPLYPLNSLTNGKSETTLDVSLGDLMSGQYAINVHKSAADAKTYVSCGDLTMMARAGSTNPNAGGTAGMPATGVGGEHDGILALIALCGAALAGAGARIARRTR